MPTHDTLIDLFGDIADAIREKTGESGAIVADSFPTAIQAIVTGIETTIEVTTQAGATVTATKGTITVTKTANDSGHCSLEVSEAGTWSVNATLGGASDGPVMVEVVSEHEITIPFAKPVLNDNDWATISMVSSLGEGENYWSVGDTKDVILNGNLAGTSYSNKVVSAVIIGFNHNAAKEGSNRIHFQLGKIGSAQIALCDSTYDDYGSSGGFRMNLSGTNSGGWDNSYMRKTVLGNSGSPASPPANSLLAVVEEGLRKAVKSVTKWTDNAGNGSGDSGDVTSTKDYFFLLAEFEVQGTRLYANQYEQNQQVQYSFYKSGNSKTRYQDTSTRTAVYWWLRSPNHNTTNGFCSTHSDGSAARGSGIKSRGLAPGFCV